MFELARKVAHYTVLHEESTERIKRAPTDNNRMRDLKRNLHVLYVGMYKSLLLASAQLTISLYGDWQYIKNLMKHYDWEGQIKELDEYHQLCKDYRDEMIARQKDLLITQTPIKVSKSPDTAQAKQKLLTGPISSPEEQKAEEKALMGPSPRNPLHWAVALGVSEQVTYLVQKDEYPINALTPRKWTAAHLAARQGNTKIIKTLLTAPGLDLKIRNDEGRTALHIAALHNKVAAVKLILQRERGLLGHRDNRGRTAFLLAAQKGHVKVLTIMKENGQDFNEATVKEGWTALHLAADNNQLEAVKFLLAGGTKKSTKTKAGNREGLTARQIAEQKRKLEIVAIL
jgi:ankyrin repeat protein